MDIAECGARSTNELLGEHVWSLDPALLHFPLPTLLCPVK